MTSKDAVPLRIAYIGGGSRGWARILMNDLACCPTFTGEIRLFDTDYPSAKLNEKLGNWLQDYPGVVSHWNYRAVNTLSDALNEADFVFMSILPGSFDFMEREIAVAAEYGMYFPVGDTVGVPGLMRGLRAAIVYASYAHAVVEYCPNAWVVNYTNPMTICTRTLTRAEPDLKVFGCCHEVFGSQHVLAGLAKKYLDLPSEPSRDEIRVNVIGINHFTWINKAVYQDHNLLELLRQHIQQPGILRQYTRQEVEEADNFFQDHQQVKFELFKRYGILAAAGDRHLVEFVPGFIQSADELYRWGLILTPVAARRTGWSADESVVQDYLEGRRIPDLNRSNEEAIRQMEALLGLGDLITNVNLENKGQIANLPLHAVVETNAYFSRNSVQPITAGSLPPGVHGLISRHVENQELILEAALDRDKEMAFQAIFNDPNTHLPIDKAWEMFNKIGLPEDLWNGYEPAYAWFR